MVLANPPFSKKSMRTLLMVRVRSVGAASAVTTSWYDVSTLVQSRTGPMGQSVVSIRELKGRLSHYLRLAREGESVVITDRGVPIGRIVPIGQNLEQRLAAIREAGIAQWSGRKLGRRTPLAKLCGEKTVAQLLVEDRG